VSGLSRVWRIRLVVTASVWLSLDVLMVIAGMGPRHLVLGLAVAALASLCWVAYDLAADVRAPDWRTMLARPTMLTGYDSRVSRIKLHLYDESGSGRASGRLHLTLVELIDDRVLSRHGIDRAIQPDAARAAMGDTLHRFVTAPLSQRDMADRRMLDRVLTCIEDL
jgi:hypothetical protein